MLDVVAETALILSFFQTYSSVVFPSIPGKNEISWFDLKCSKSSSLWMPEQPSGLEFPCNKMRVNQIQYQCKTDAKEAEDPPIGKRA